MHACLLRTYYVRASERAYSVLLSLLSSWISVAGEEREEIHRAVGAATFVGDGREERRRGADKREEEGEEVKEPKWRR